MKTTKISATLASVALIIFMSVGSIANTASKFSGDLTKSTTKTVIAAEKNSVSSAEAVNEFSYLRFNADNFLSNSDMEEVTYASLDYLRFDVDKFTNSSEEITEMPAENFDYLRFDVNNYIENTEAEITEMPTENFDYLHFDVNNYFSENQAQPSDMTADDFSYLRFDVSKYSTNSTDSLPSAE